MNIWFLTWFLWEKSEFHLFTLCLQWHSFNFEEYICRYKQYLHIYCLRLTDMMCIVFSHLEYNVTVVTCITIWMSFGKVVDHLYDY